MQQQQGNGKFIPHVSPSGVWMTKLALRILSLIFIIAALALGGSYVSASSSSCSYSYYSYDTCDYYDYTGYVGGIIPIIAIAPASALALIWDISEGIAIMVRGGHRGIHPGANVALDLLIWLGFLSATVALSLLGLAATFGFGALRKGPAIIGLSGTLIVIHFTLFVIACYETHLRNTAGSRMLSQMAQNQQTVQNMSAPVQPNQGAAVAIPQQAYAQMTMHQAQMPQMQQFQQYQPPMQQMAVAPYPQ